MPDNRTWLAVTVYSHNAEAFGDFSDFIEGVSAAVNVRLASVFVLDLGSEVNAVTSDVGENFGDLFVFNHRSFDFVSFIVL